MTTMIQKEKDAKAKYPKHCDHCYGSGIAISIHFPGESWMGGEELGDICPKCVDKGICPRCAITLNFPDGCDSCDWDLDSNSDALY